MRIQFTLFDKSDIPSELNITGRLPSYKTRTQNLMPNLISRHACLTSRHACLCPAPTTRARTLQGLQNVVFGQMIEGEASKNALDRVGERILIYFFKALFLLHNGKQIYVFNV